MTVRKAERTARLMHLLSERRVIHLSEAASLLGVSEMTVRRDIATNQDQIAYLGGHILAAAEIDADVPYELATAADSHAAAKRAACLNAVRRIRPDETIFIDCGTTLVHLVDLIPDNYQITAICYAMNVAERLTRKANVTTIVLGGVYHPASASFSGTHDFDILSSVGINAAFLSAAGIDAERGATCEHFHEAVVKQKVMGLARENFLVADSSKFGRLKRAYFAPVGAFDAIITEHGDVAPDAL
ncbi:DeoR/GlpR transcriptional regulator [Mesorhizobium sp. CU2]|uniref:DeoR/GlpR family DNA-binding transcription regulator n=1 Tax=unclassified Mesorhizobium TaxID=325217 RepID=UPI00112A66CF|nr:MULTISPECIES: DeoR/GlpR family DNA-binding transcription regulator [unclassified Mesorhizobium]TPN76707.1 DeoR/GlpR transcriptional regulator [Mesorhizobium sp. CU3]TPO01572.1 DeoR/GlpR transcriptional regulator [Mesorhizobium sp. CU2]